MKRDIEAGTVRDIMTPNPVTVTPETSVGDLKRLFETHDFNMFPVVDRRGVLRGLVTKLDFLRMFRPGPFRVIPNLRALWAERVEHVMSRGLIAAEPDDPIVTVIDSMLASGLRSLPVVERRAQGRVLVGIVSRTDVLRRLAVEPEAAP
jgi:CBS-domain-containing membrane protein